MPQDFWFSRPRIYLNGDTSVTPFISKEREELVRRKTVHMVLPSSLGQSHGGDVLTRTLHL